mgnify:CR=1 FL=1
MTHLCDVGTGAQRLPEAGYDSVAPADVQVMGTRMIDEVKMEGKLTSHFGFASESFFQENCQ